MFVRIAYARVCAVLLMSQCVNYGYYYCLYAPRAWLDDDVLAPVWMEWMNDELNDRYPKYWRKWNAHVARSHIFNFRIHIRFNTGCSSFVLVLSRFPIFFISFQRTRLVLIRFGSRSGDLGTMLLHVCVFISSFVYCSYNCIHFVKKRKKARRENWMRMRKNYMCKNHWNRL